MLKLNLSSEGIIVFDIGGTWFRSGYITGEGKLIKFSKTPAVNFKNSPLLKVDELQEKLVSYIVSETLRLQKEIREFCIKRAAISIGAAVKGYTGYILNSGPLWGIHSKPINLLMLLRKRIPTINWTILNDLTAALLWHVSQTQKKFNKASLFTISTGIGSRIYDRYANEIPLDEALGIQGEIGHLPITFQIEQKNIEQYCDCGGLNHLNAFCSGRGIEALLPCVSKHFITEFKTSTLKNKDIEELRFVDLVDSIRKGDSFAQKVIDLVTFPIAEILLRLFTFDPKIDLVFITGGVVHSLQPYYERSLLKHLRKLGLYLVCDFDPEFFQKRIEVKDSDEQAGLWGAALSASFGKEKLMSH